EDDDEDPEEDLVDYPANGGDDGYDEDEPSDDDEDEDEEDDIKADDEEEEHPAPADSTVVVRLAISTPPSSPLFPWSSPLPQIPFPPLPLTPSPSLPLSPPLPVSAPPPASPIRIALGPRYEVGESSSTAAARLAGGLRVDYGFIATMDREIRHDLERDDTNEIYTRLDDEQTEQQLMAGRLNMLYKDRRAYAQVMSLCTTVLAQQSEIRELQLTDRKRQTMITEMLAADHRRQVRLTKALKLLKGLQTHMTELQRHQGPTNGLA
ncbi:hypothetical protein Tco_1290721, partial [Tanacetum coccineum]